MGFKNIKRRKIHEDVAEQIENQIISGLIKEGSSLPPERSLMKTLKVAVQPLGKLFFYCSVMAW